jgi:competence protein ComEC
MIPGVLVLSIVAGIVWSDMGHRLPVPLVASWLLGAGALLCAFICQIRDAAKPGHHRRIGSGTLRGSGVICVAGLAFFAGFDRLDRELSRAQLDAERAHRVTREAVRIAEARVGARRSGRFGDEVELVDLRAADAEGPLPESLILRLPEPATSRVGASPSRVDRLLWPGAWVRIGLRVSPLRASRNPGTPDREHHMARRGQAARARLVKPDWILALSSDSRGGQGLADQLRRARAQWRRRVGARLEKEGGAGALVGALALGDRGGLQNETREAFRRLGLSHLLAVSGLHVGLVAGLAGWLFLRSSSRVLRRVRRTQLFDWTLGVACGAAALYAWITGAGISVERAVLLFGLFAACRLCLRTMTPAVALAWVGAGILLMDPAALFDVGAQLSFGACIALIIGGLWKSGATPSPASNREPDFKVGILHAASETFRASLVISLVTAPVLVQHGIPLAVLAPAVNVIAIPCLGFLVLPTSLLAVLLAGPLPASGFSVLMLPAYGFEACVVRAATLLPEPLEHGWLPLPFILLATGLSVFWIRQGKWNRALLVWLGISLAGGTPGLLRPISLDRPRVVFFEVGQGDASLVQGREAVLVIDTGSGPSDGSGGAQLVRGLRAMGVDSIDVLAVTHADLDHRAGARRVLAVFPVEELWLPLSAIEDAPLLALSDDALERGTRVRWLASGARGTHRGDLEIEVLWPPPSVSSKAVSRNESSLVLRVVVDETVFLFTADVGVAVEKELIASRSPLFARVLKVAHHGSRRSSSAAFLDAVSATIAVVSAPCDPSRGLPSRSTLERLHRSGASLWWTGRDGAVIVSQHGVGQTSVKGWGRPRRCLRP